MCDLKKSTIHIYLKKHTTTEAEAFACRRALEFAVDIGFSKLVIEGDSIQVINATNSNKANLSRLGHVFVQMQNLDLNPIKDAYCNIPVNQKKKKKIRFF